MNTIILKSIFSLERHSKESFTEVWKRECKQFYNLARNEHDIETVDVFEANIELMAEREFDRILEKQREFPVDTKNQKIIDHTK